MAMAARVTETETTRTKTRIRTKTKTKIGTTIVTETAIATMETATPAGTDAFCLARRG
jgi:hypothetical protein